jgi:hypothetical protein
MDVPDPGRLILASVVDNRFKDLARLYPLSAFP